MREIKFKGKKKGGSEWLIGDLNHVNSRVFIFDRTSTTLNSPDWYEVAPETVGQFSGLKDKNGKEIYEGDIIQCYYAEQKHGAIERVEFREGAFILRHRTVPISVYLEHEATEIEVIGNIHENPELLK